jgi:hypothetical protein
MPHAKLYRRIEVWRQQDRDTAIRYTCLEDVRENRFWVKSADHVRYPLDKAARRQIDEQANELVLDFLFFDGADLVWRDTIADAIDEFDREFEN